MIITYEIHGPIEHYDEIIKYIKKYKKKKIHFHFYEETIETYYIYISVDSEPDCQKFKAEIKFLYCPDKILDIETSKVPNRENNLKVFHNIN